MKVRGWILCSVTSDGRIRGVSNDSYLVKPRGRELGMPVYSDIEKARREIDVFPWEGDALALVSGEGKTNLKHSTITGEYVVEAIVSTHRYTESIERLVKGELEQ